MTRRALPWAALLGVAWACAAWAGPPEPTTQPAAHTATGTLQAYEPGSRLLTVSSAGGSVAFTVATDARAWLGNRRLPLQRLPEHVGAQVTVSWSDADGERTTHTVRVLPSAVAAR